MYQIERRPVPRQYRIGIRSSTPWDDNSANWTSQVLTTFPTDRAAPRGFSGIRSLIACILCCGTFAAVSAAEPAPWPDSGVNVQNARILYLNESTLASSRLGIIKKLNVKEGSQVELGDELLILDDRVVEAQYATAKMQASNDVEIHFAVASSELARAEYELNLQANLRVPGAVPLIEVERLRLAYLRSLWQIKQAKHQQKVEVLKSYEAGELKNTYRVNAEFPGIITKVHKSIGEGVREGDPILDIVDPSRVKVEGFIHIEDAFRVKKGCAVKIKLEIPEFDIPEEDVIFDGKLTFVDNSVDFVQQEKLRVTAEVENNDLILRQGFQARMIIITDIPQPVRKGSGPKTAFFAPDHVPVLQ